MSKIISCNPYPDEPREKLRGGVHTAFERGKKAQRDASDKEWIGWGDEYCMEHDHPDILQRQCGRCWESKLKELKQQVERDDERTG